MDEQDDKIGGASSSDRATTCWYKTTRAEALETKEV